MIKEITREDKIDKKTRKFVERALKESCEVNFPKLLLFTFRELRIEQPGEWKNTIMVAMDEPVPPEVPVESKSKPDKIDKIANPASIAAFFLSVIAGALLYFKYDQGLAVAISVMISIIVFIVLTAFKLNKK